MARVITDDLNYINIASTIRDKVGVGNTYAPSQMPEGIEKVYEAGQANKENAFWGIITKNGERLNYQSAFSFWDIDYIRPTLDGHPLKLQPTSQGSANQTFSHNPSLLAVESKYFDFSKMQYGSANTYGYYYTWYNCGGLIEVQDIGIGKEIYPNSYVSTWSNCYELKHILGMGFNQNTRFENVFVNCNELEELVIYEGSVLGQSGFNIRWSKKLNKKSIEGIFTVPSTETSGLSITLSKTAVNKAFETSEGLNDGSTSSEWLNLIATRTNWTINLL